MVVRLRLAILVTAACAALAPAAAEPLPPDHTTPTTAPAAAVLALAEAAASEPDQIELPEDAAAAAAPDRAAPDGAAVATLADLAVPSTEAPATSTAAPLLAPSLDIGDIGEVGVEYELSRRDADSFLHRITARLQELVQAAMTYLGTPYRRGGSSRRGLDCSGLVGAVYAQQGLLVPRTAAEQFGEGIPVAQDDLRPGDLVFFRDTYKRGISHVGIYVGDGRFIHAAGRRRGVVVSELASAYYRSRYAGARRLATQTADAALDGGADAAVAGVVQSKIDGSAATSTPASALRNR